MSVPVRPPWLLPRLYSFWDEQDDLRILRATIQGEAAGEGDLGCFAVGCVMRTRVQLPYWWGDTYTEICLWSAQFSCWWSDWPLRGDDIRGAFRIATGRYERAHEAALRVLAGEPDITGGASHYLNPRHARPEWTSHLLRTCRIGHHDFYGYE